MHSPKSHHETGGHHPSPEQSELLSELAALKQRISDIEQTLATKLGVDPKEATALADDLLADKMEHDITQVGNHQPSAEQTQEITDDAEAVAVAGSLEHTGDRLSDSHNPITVELERGRDDELTDGIKQLADRGAEGEQLAHTATEVIDAAESQPTSNHLDKPEDRAVYTKDYADRWIEEGRDDAVADNLDKFEPGAVDHEDLADRLIEDGKGHVVADNLDKFVGLDHQALADRLIKRGRGDAVARNLDKFVGLDESVIDRLIDEDLGYVVADNLDKFVGLDHQALADRLIKDGQSVSVANNLGKFEPGAVDHNALADHLIEQGQGGVVARNLDKFVDLDQSVIDRLKHDYIK